jgi:uncharacterized protein
MDGAAETRDQAGRLTAALAGYDSTLVAFSGGVDSALVVAAALRALGPARTVALTAVSPSLPARELAAAREWCRDIGVEHLAVDTAELEVPGYRENGPLRCFFCKSVLLDTAVAVARERGIRTVATGTNASDVLSSHRPGIRAAAERGARTPLADAGLDKDAVRRVARLWKLPMWDKPAAACLASRVAYGIEVTSHRLGRIERAERALRGGLGDRTRDLRVRDLGDRVRIEVDAAAVAGVRADAAVAEAVRAAGFGAVPVSVEPFRSGSLNDALREPPGP